MDVNATTNKNEIVQLASGGDQAGDNWFIGHPIHVGNDALMCFSKDPQPRPD
jgi:hypothetical protein